MWLDRWIAGVAEKVKMSRFRPNLVIDDALFEGFEEDEWIGKIIMIGNARFRVDGPCARCTMITINQEDGTCDNDAILLWELRKHRPSEAKRGFTQ